MMGVLVVVAGPAAGRRIDLTGPVTVGRREGEVVIEDPEISRRHCTIAPGPHGEVVITDLGSTNGTWINGTRIGVPTVVRPGDEVRLGDCVCRLDAPKTPPPVAPSPVVPPQAAAPVGSAPPQQPFGAFASAAAVAAPVKPRRRGAATRLPAGIVFAWAVIGLDALALIVYFAAR
jgi:predicted component of type VI protein secretion system